MTVIEHLTELRYRLFISIIATIVGMILAYIFYHPILAVLKHPLDIGGHIGDRRVDDLYITGVATALIMRIKVSMFAGFVFALPVVMYQLWRFVTPGLEAKEKRFAIPFVLSSLVLFSLGAWLAFTVAPYGIRFLLGFAGNDLTPLIHFTEYINFIMVMVLAFGVSFEYPLVLVFLAAAGFITSKQLRGFRRYAVFLCAVAAAIATPQQDIYSNVGLALPLYVLYELTIVVVRFALRK